MCRAHGVEAIVLKAEVSKREEVRAMVEKAVEHFGRIDILINNAGILGNALAPMEVTKEKLRELSLTGEIVKPEEIAYAVIFLLENDHITGEVVDVNGGRLMD